MIRIPSIHGQETALIFQFCAESFESDLNIYCMYSSVMNAAIRLLSLVRENKINCLKGEGAFLKR